MQHGAGFLLDLLCAVCSSFQGSTVLHQVIQIPLVFQCIFAYFSIAGAEDDLVSDQCVCHGAVRTRTLEIAPGRFTLDSDVERVEAVIVLLNVFSKLVVGQSFVPASIVVCFQCSDHVAICNGGTSVAGDCLLKVLL